MIQLAQWAEPSYAALHDAGTSARKQPCVAVMNSTELDWTPGGRNRRGSQPASIRGGQEYAVTSTDQESRSARHLSAARVVTVITFVSSCPRRGPMNWSKWIRQAHRWLAITFTVTVIASIVAAALPEPATWVFYVPLLPLTLLLSSGLYLFVLPHATKWRDGHRPARAR
jgi:hypothetical protein